MLLKIFPRTDFYLTEYCLAAKTVGKSFVVVVSKADQARYLREAFALLAKPQYKRVKAMLWYQVQGLAGGPLAGGCQPRPVHGACRLDRPAAPGVVRVRRRQSDQHHGAARGGG